jgi:hypothetical protein
MRLMRLGRVTVSEWGGALQGSHGLLSYWSPRVSGEKGEGKRLAKLLSRPRWCMMCMVWFFFFLFFLVEFDLLSKKFCRSYISFFISFHHFLLLLLPFVFSWLNDLIASEWMIGPKVSLTPRAWLGHYLGHDSGITSGVTRTWLGHTLPIPLSPKKVKHESIWYLTQKLQSYPRSAEDEQKSKNVWLEGHTGEHLVFPDTSSNFWMIPISDLQVLTKDGQWKWVRHIENAIVSFKTTLIFTRGLADFSIYYRVVQPPQNQQNFAHVLLCYFALLDDSVKLWTRWTESCPPVGWDKEMLWCG